MTSFAVQLGRHALAERGDDFYETPAQATLALLRHEPLLARPTSVWEPACGKGAISQILEAAGHEVTSTDLVARGYGAGGIDFLLEQRAPPGCGLILTNPPFKLMDEFVRHGLRLAPHVIVLARWAYAEGAKRSDLIDECLDRVWLGRERLPFMHRNGWSGPVSGNSGAPFAWFVFGAKRNRAGFSVARISWRAS